MLTKHAVHLADARNLSFVPSPGATASSSATRSQTSYLVETSPLYGPLIHHPDGPDQLGNMQSYELFLDELDKVWAKRLNAPHLNRVVYLCLAAHRLEPPGFQQNLNLSANLRPPNRPLKFAGLRRKF